MPALLLLLRLHVDHLNTPRLVSNQSGQTVWRWDQQEPFGVNVPDENPSGLGAFDLPVRLPGQYFDKETNLHYNMARNYWPDGGRYVEPDPLGIATTWPHVPMAGLNHPYLYASATPLSSSDFSGLLDEGGSGRGGGGGGMQLYRCPLVQQVGPIGMAYFIGMPRFLFICVYDCGVKCPPDAADLVYQYVWLWNFPFKCEPSIRNPTGRGV